VGLADEEKKKPKGRKSRRDTVPFKQLPAGNIFPIFTKLTISSVFELQYFLIRLMFVEMRTLTATVG
jgi:hypothetical protein